MTLMIVGDYWSKEDLQNGQSFSSGMRYLLNTFLDSAQINKDDCYFTDVFHEYPTSSNIFAFCGTKAEGIPDLPLIAQGKYIKREHEHHIERLYREIKIVKPNLILALGAAAFAVLLRAKVPLRANRGGVFFLDIPGYDTPVKVLGTHHPREIHREWNLRPIVIADFIRASDQMCSPDYNRPHRMIWTEPTIPDLHSFEKEFLTPDWAVPCGVDIETKRETITEIGFSPRTDLAIVIPFYSREHRDGNYWRTPREELLAWITVRRWLLNLRTPIFQNGLYDLNYLWRTMGMITPGAGEDTMLLAHALQPELKKGLAFLGSIYGDEPPWKMMRKRGNETMKKEDT